MRILIADDDRISLKFLQSALSGAGHTVEAFEDGQALWEVFEQKPAQLIVTDWMMPRLSGVALCQRIRQSALTAYTHVILVTSQSSAEHLVEGYRAGVDDYLAKPFQLEDLTRRVAVAERGMLAQVEGSLRNSLEICQASLGPEHASLLGALAALTAVSREQRAYVRCRAFLRRQHGIALANFGATDPRTLQLVAELEEMASFEEKF
jgi:DNA-binding response OmpR family regulator